MSEIKRKVVLGLGNLINKDEGVGIHAVYRMRSFLGPIPGVEWVDGGVSGLDLLALVEDCSHLLVLDAIDAGLPAGTMIELDKEQIPRFMGIKLSQHQVSFQEVLALANWRDKLPSYLNLIGIQPADITLGLDLSPVVQTGLLKMSQYAKNVLSRWEISELATM